jgi:hypothetical protein
MAGLNSCVFRQPDFLAPIRLTGLLALASRLNHGPKPVLAMVAAAPSQSNAPWTIQAGGSGSQDVGSSEFIDWGHIDLDAQQDI